ncbi:DUF5779 family protein [Haloarculaceae archaeon H-GB1-1]|nr:DUF5779 family protein [Haloarculaceae archaeon H-GB1-1]
MSEFDLDLRAVEEQIEETEPERRVVLGILDGSDDDDWADLVEEGNVLVLNVDGDVNERAAGFARDVKENGGELMHFRGFLVVTPADVDIDTDRL